MKSLFGWVLFIGLAVMLFLLLQKGKTQYAPISITDFKRELEAGRVQSAVVGDDRVVGEFREPVEQVLKFQVELPTGTTSQWAFTQWVTDNAKGADVRADRDAGLLRNILVPLIPWVLIFGFIWFFVFRQLRPQNNRPR